MKPKDQVMQWVNRHTAKKPHTATEQAMHAQHELNQRKAARIAAEQLGNVHHEYWDAPVQSKFKEQEELIRMIQDDIAKQVELKTNSMYMGYDKGAGMSRSAASRISTQDGKIKVEHIPYEKLLMTSEAFSAAVDEQELWKTHNNEKFQEELTLNFKNGEFI